MQSNLSPRDEVIAIRNDAERIRQLGNELRYILNERPACACGAFADWDGDECRKCHEENGLDLHNMVMGVY